MKKPQSKLATSLSSQSTRPDSYQQLSSYLSPSDDFVISRGLDGSVISQFKDNIWDVRVYDARNKCVYNFSSWHSSDGPLKQEIIQELKITQLARLYLAGPQRKVNSIRMMYLRKLATLAFNNKVTLTELFNDAGNHPFIISSFSALPPTTMKPLLAVLRDLFSIRARHPDFKIAPSNYGLMESLEEIFNKYPKEKFNAPLQTKLIPSRIYGELIIALSTILENFNNHSSIIIKMYKKRERSPQYAVPQLHRERSKNTVSWNTAVKEIGLSSFFEELSISNWKHLIIYIGQVQAAAKYWIHLFSGMRDNEANFLPADTYPSFDAGGVSFKILKGYTSKIDAQNHTSTFWVTHQIIEKGLDAAIAIGKISAVACGWDDQDIAQFPLFPSKIAKNKNAGSSNKHTWHFRGAPVSGSISDTVQLELISNIPNLRIQEEDICELERFDGFRDWRNDPDLKIGEPWPLATHQCRRALAVYGARSGMLSLGASALQFKQLTEAMASYYRKGSLFAVNFLDSDDARGWIDELEHERRAAQFINYEKDVINSTSRLWGGEGSRIQQARNKGQPLIISTDRSLTEQKFLKGEMVYKIGPIGGCTNSEPCQKISYTNILACIDCEKSILDEEYSLRNIKRGLSNLKRGQATFSPDNPRYQQLESEIKSLYKKLERQGLLKKIEELQ
ncbi:hypothetical protein [Pseudomonas sp. CES]|uniref:hypothetical protein n=1 Tax=Pseudomonas sp. CES TaxID=2719586 RepID=UPI0014702064|nr:hypothetical protein [Pseudomonas sp. CES]KAF4558716.1 hypothetical protein HBJ16_003707 [Pseudomonas sp. CES]